MKKQTLQERFEALVDKGGVCWRWTGYIGRTGYGKIRVNGKDISAHRASYQMHKGDLPNGMVVMHTCDNRQCVNPEHLVLGTQRDNMQDMSKKGRAPGKNNTHCRHGHEFTEATTEIYTNRGIKCRRCRICTKNRVEAAKQLAKDQKPLRTTCTNGHVLAQVGEYFSQSGKYVLRQCRACALLKQVKRREKKKETLNIT